MSIITKASAKQYFLTGAFPTQNQFADTIDSYLGLGETGSQTVPSPVAFGANITVSGDITATPGRITASAATLSGGASIGGVVSAASLNVTGDVAANTGRVNASAATIANKVSATQVYASTVTVSGANITGVQGNTAIIASVSGTVSSGHAAAWDASGNLVDAGASPISSALVPLSTINASGAASVTFSSTFITTTYNRYILYVDNFVSSNGADSGSLNLTLSTNNGGAYATTGYLNTSINTTSANTTVTSVNTGTTSILVIPVGFCSDGNTTAGGTAFEIQFVPSAVSFHCYHEGCGETTAGAYVRWSGSGNNLALANVNNIKLALSSGANISGNFHLYGVVN